MDLEKLAQETVEKYSHPEAFHSQYETFEVYQKKIISQVHEKLEDFREDLIHAVDILERHLGGDDE